MVQGGPDGLITVGMVLKPSGPSFSRLASFKAVWTALKPSDSFKTVQVLNWSLSVRNIVDCVDSLRRPPESVFTGMNRLIMATYYKDNLLHSCTGELS